MCPLSSLSCLRNKIPLLAKSPTTKTSLCTEMRWLENVLFLHASFCALYVCFSLLLLVSNQLSSTRKLISCIAAGGGERRLTGLPAHAGSCLASSAEFCCRIGCCNCTRKHSLLSSYFAKFVPFLYPFCTFISFLPPLKQCIKSLFCRRPFWK